MNKFAVKITSLLLLSSLFGCEAQYRKAAMSAERESQRINREGTYDLYNIVVRKTLSSVKARLRLEKDSLDKMVAVTDRKGKVHQITRLDQIVNEEVQAIVDAGWIYKNQATAEGLSDQAMIYMGSREGFIEVLANDVKSALSSDVTSQPG